MDAAVALHCSLKGQQPQPPQAAAKRAGVALEGAEYPAVQVPLVSIEGGEANHVLVPLPQFLEPQHLGHPPEQTEVEADRTPALAIQWSTKRINCETIQSINCVNLHVATRGDRNLVVPKDQPDPNHVVQENNLGVLVLPKRAKIEKRGGTLGALRNEGGEVHLVLESLPPLEALPIP